MRRGAETTHMHLNWLWLLLPILLGAAVLQATLRGRVRHAANEPQCGKCGYNVTGLPGTVCPECGSDLGVVGIKHPGQWVPASRWVRALGWTAFVGLAVLLPLLQVMVELRPYLPSVHDATMSRDFGLPESGAYNGIELTAHARAVTRRPLPPPQKVTLTLVLKDGRRATQQIGLEDLSQWDAPRFTAWMKNAGVVAPQDALLAEARWVRADVERRLKAPAEGAASFPGGYGSGGYGTSTYSSTIDTQGPFLANSDNRTVTVQPARWQLFLPFSVAVLVWLVGLVWIVRRKPALSSPATAARQPP
jgi:hypothetical protein